MNLVERFFRDLTEFLSGNSLVSTRQLGEAIIAFLAARDETLGAAYGRPRANIRKIKAAKQALAAGQSESNAILETPHLGGRSACRGDRCRLHLAMLPVRLGPREITHYFLAPWPVSRLPHLENRRLGFEPLC